MKHFPFCETSCMRQRLCLLCWVEFRYKTNRLGHFSGMYFHFFLVQYSSTYLRFSLNAFFSSPFFTSQFPSFLYILSGIITLYHQYMFIFLDSLIDWELIDGWGVILFIFVMVDSNIVHDRCLKILAKLKYENYI